ncbi:MAG: acetate kinase, partial [Gemmatimonadota bacterium]
MNVLVLNAGSSTLKFQVIETDAQHIANHSDARRIRGLIERIGGESVITIRRQDGSVSRLTAKLRDMRSAVEWLVDYSTSAESGSGLTSRADLHAVGHRVVHGGERFRSSVRIDADVRNGIEEMIELAPLHNPNN